MSLHRQIKAARRAGTPIVAVNTPDPAATVVELGAAINGGAPRLEWDIIRGFRPLNEAGASAISTINAENAAFSPHGAMVEAGNLPDRTVLFVHNAHLFTGDAMFKQAVWNLRDAYKSTGRMLVLLGQGMTLPPELAGDALMLDEPLPDDAAIGRIVADLAASVGMDLPAATQEQAVQALAGLPAFQAEQATAESFITEENVGEQVTTLDVPSLWERKKRQIEQTPGLTVFRGTDRFDSIGGCEAAKQFIGRTLAGRYKPRAIVWIDEIEKALAGAKGDTSGVSQDQLATLLGYIEDHGHLGMILNGPPGTAKSALAKAAGCEAGIPTVRLDLGGLKGSLVGQSEQQLRAALKVITAVSSDKAFWIATSNSVANMDTAMLRRLPDVFYCDLPDKQEREAIWTIWRRRYDLLADESHVDVNDEGWVGANIRKACEKAWQLDCTLVEASRYVVPVGKTAAGEIAKLRQQAEGVFLSASYPGPYVQNRNLTTASVGRRISQS